MDDCALLKFVYKGTETEVFIEDVDLVNLLDMIIDYWDKAESMGHLMPKHPSFSYVYKKKNIQIVDDKTLVEMFSRNRGVETIVIKVGESKPSALLDNARRLRETLKETARKKELEAEMARNKPVSSDDGDDDDVVMIIPTPSLPQEKLNVNADDDLNLTALNDDVDDPLNLTGFDDDVGVQVDEMVVDDIDELVDEMAVDDVVLDDMAVDAVDDVVVEPDPIPTPLLVVYPLPTPTLPVEPDPIPTPLLVADVDPLPTPTQLDDPDPIPTPVQNVKPKTPNKKKGYWRPKLPVLRPRKKPVETIVLENPPSPGEINDVILENAEFFNEMNEEVQVENEEGNIEEEPTLKKPTKRTPTKKTPSKRTPTKSPMQPNKKPQPKPQPKQTPTKTPKTTITKRIPMSTLRRKGIKQVVTRRSPRLLELTKEKEGDASTSGHIPSESEDESFVPSVHSDSESESDSVSLIDSEEEIAVEDIDVVDDSFDPYDGPVWDEHCDTFDSYLNKLYRNGQLFEESTFGNIQIREWQLFTDRQHMKDVIRNYCIQSGFSLVIDKSDKRRYTARCSDANCDWRLHASILPDGITWAIKKITNSEHTCLGLETKNSMVTVKWACNALLEDIRANNDIPGKALNELLWSRYGVEMAQAGLYRVRNMALNIINGGHDTSYGFLPSYCEIIKETNVGSHANCAWYPNTHPEYPLVFKSIFISFKASLDGLFAGCRSLIGVDGCHLKGNYGGVLLSAIALDGNNEIFPIAWAIVSSEDEESWKFFIWHLKHALEPSQRGDNWCIISDRQKGIDKAITDLWPKVQRRYCCKHLSANWKKVFPGPKLWQLFWLACGAFSTFTFGKAMKELDKENKAARAWLAELGPQERWTKHKFDVSLKCDMNKTNFVESFNATLGTDRCKPVLTLLEGIRRVTMVRLATRRQKCESWDKVCPNIVKRVQTLCNDSRSCRAFMSSVGEYEVLEGKSALAVSLNNHTCLCNVWQLTGIPCKHVMRAILHEGLDPHSFVHECYSVERYKMAYGESMKPIPDQDKWPASESPSILPPLIKRGVGRPCRNRRRAEDEARKGKRSKTVTCGKCGEFGHNKSTCKGGATKKQRLQKQPDEASTSKLNKKTVPKSKASQKGKGKVHS